MNVVVFCFDWYQKTTHRIQDVTDKKQQSMQKKAKILVRNIPDKIKDVQMAGHFGDVRDLRFSTYILSRL